MASRRHDVGTWAAPAAIAPAPSPPSPLMAAAGAANMVGATPLAT